MVVKLKIGDGWVGVEFGQIASQTFSRPARQWCQGHKTGYDEV